MDANCDFVDIKRSDIRSIILLTRLSAGGDSGGRRAKGSPQRLRLGKLIDLATSCVHSKVSTWSLAERSSWCGGDGEGGAESVCPSAMLPVST